jgi:hypothetical protein
VVGLMMMTTTTMTRAMMMTRSMSSYPAADLRGEDDVGRGGGGHGECDDQPGGQRARQPRPAATSG